MEGISSMPRGGHYFEDFVLTNDGILKIVFLSKAKEYLILSLPIGVVLLAWFLVPTLLHGNGAMVAFAGTILLILDPLLAGLIVRRVKASFYARFAYSAPIGMGNVKIIPWAAVASARVFVARSSARGIQDSKTRLEFTTLEKTQSCYIETGQVHGFVSMLTAKLGERFEDQRRGV